ncbi:hypothetical protein [Desulfofalx alkaliphila]|uniref:hypothetical protein n=1 Tax=Desulfofalx alkaliphila TaxID=105483 RepID=UPI0004E2451A|nr:hypothetical protein [Desulfofalx alkaliphila]
MYKRLTALTQPACLPQQRLATINKKSDAAGGMAPSMFELSELRRRPQARSSYIFPGGVFAECKQAGG